jgi:hypothetical protein
MRRRGSKQGVRILNVCSPEALSEAVIVAYDTLLSKYIDFLGIPQLNRAV